MRQSTLAEIFYKILKILETRLEVFILNKGFAQLIIKF